MAPALEDESLTQPQERVIYCRNMILLLLSLVVGGETLLGILVSWRQATRYNASRRLVYLMMVILLGIEVLRTITWIIGVNIAAAVDGVTHSTQLSAARGDKLCYPVSLLSFWLDIMIFTWHACMAYFIWAWIVQRKYMDLLLRRLRHALAVCMVLSVLVTLIPVVNNNLGLWLHHACFVRQAKTVNRPLASIIMSRMVVLSGCWLFIMVLNTWTIQHLRTESRRYYALSGIKNLQVRLLAITTIFPVVWILQSLPLYMRRRTFAMEIGFRWAHGIGFYDALIFGYPTFVFFFCRSAPERLLGFFSLRWVRHLRRPPQEQPTIPRAAWEMITHNPSTTAHLPPCFSLSSATSSFSSSHLSPYRIFATTFDLNYQPLSVEVHSGRVEHLDATTRIQELVLKRGLEAWIPIPSSGWGGGAGGSGGFLYHLYVIALQRCRGLPKLRQAIHKHLGGPAHYVLTGAAEMGDPLHGRTALLVFARTVDVESGAFQLLAANQRPIVMRDLRGGTKGMLGVSFRYYDATVAVINAHLPATSVYPGLDPLEERDKHVASMLQHLRIGSGHELWDTHLQYSHVILLGCLNYRMRLSAAEVFDRIQESSKSCQAQFEADQERAQQPVITDAESAWRKASYSRLWSLDNLMQQQQQQQQGQQQEEAKKEPEGGEHWEVERIPSQELRVEAWKWVKQKDVMSRRMAKGLLFYGWQEADITFPPTFKWRVGASADDYTDRGALETAYVTHRRGNMATHWPPSYTDRILISSQPGAASRLVVGAYDMCDQGPLACVSDHRPVSQALVVMVDTTQQLAKCLDILPEPSSVTHMQRQESSDTAWAMAGAAAVRQRGSCLPNLPDSSLKKTFPMLVRLTMSRFNFVWAQRDAGLNIGVPSPSRPAQLVRSRSMEDSVISTEGPSVRGEEQQEVNVKAPPVALPLSCMPCPVSCAYQESSPGGSAPDVDSSLSVSVDHVLVLFPAPSEDPLRSLRLAQALGESFGSTSSLSTGITMSTRSTRTEVEDSLASELERSGSGRQLQNLFHIQWTSGFECCQSIPPSATNGGPFSSQTHFPAPPVMTMEGATSSGREQIETGEPQAIQIEVLTVGPPRPCQHGLIKFMCKNGEELGQGAFNVELIKGACQLSSRTSALPYLRSHRRRSSRGDTTRRQAIALSVGGRYSGEVGFDLDVEIRKQTSDDSQLRFSGGEGGDMGAGSSLDREDV